MFCILVNVVSQNKNHCCFYKNFVAACRGKEKQCVTIESVRKILRIMELCTLSDKENRVIISELKNL